MGELLSVVIVCLYVYIISRTFRCLAFDTQPSDRWLVVMNVEGSGGSGIV